MFECIPVLILQLANFADIKIRKGCQDVRAKRFLACLVGQIFGNLAAGTCECMDGHRIAIFKKQRQRGAELSARDLSFVEFHWPSKAASHGERHHLFQSSSASRFTAIRDAPCVGQERLPESANGAEPYPQRAGEAGKRNKYRRPTSMTVSSPAECACPMRRNPDSVSSIIPSLWAVELGLAPSERIEKI